VPAAQAAWPFGGTEHVEPQPPQLAGSALVSTQAEAHFVVPPAHDDEH
jgi:hypothetical protein